MSFHVSLLWVSSELNFFTGWVLTFSFATTNKWIEDSWQFSRTGSHRSGLSGNVCPLACTPVWSLSRLGALVRFWWGWLHSHRNRTWIFLGCEWSQEGAKLPLSSLEYHQWNKLCGYHWWNVPLVVDFHEFSSCIYWMLLKRESEAICSFVGLAWTRRTRSSRLGTNLCRPSSYRFAFPVWWSCHHCMLC